jgi:succinyl-diaminopimelate desuccinylase
MTGAPLDRPGRGPAEPPHPGGPDSPVTRVSTDARARLYRRIRSWRHEMVDFQCDLTAVRALGPTNGGDGEADRAAFLEERLAGFGLVDLEHIDAPDDRVSAGTRPNTVVRVRGRAPRPVVWLMAHMDTVPPGDGSLWDGDPFVARVEEGRLVGRGVEDNQQGLTSAVFALRALLAEGVTPASDVALLLVADEETGNLYGVEHVLAARPDLIGPDDLLVVPDFGSPDGTVIEVAEKITLWIELAVRGRQVHASLPDTGVNAHRAAAHLVVRLDDRLHAEFADEDPLFSPPRSTFEPTKRDGNVPNVNTVPGKERLYFDCRLLPAHDPDAVKRVVADVAEGVERDFGVRVDVEYPTELQRAPVTPSDAPVVAELGEAIRELRGIEPVLSGIGGGTVAAVFRRRGIPAVVWATLDGTAHSPNEYCVVDNLVADACVFARLFARSG